MENRTEKQTPETELKEVKTDIANLLGWFDCEMAKRQRIDRHPCGPQVTLYGGREGLG